MDVHQWLRGWRPHWPRSGAHGHRGGDAPRGRERGCRGRPHRKVVRRGHRCRRSVSYVTVRKRRCAGRLCGRPNRGARPAIVGGDPHGPCREPVRRRSGKPSRRRAPRSAHAHASDS